MLAETLKQLVFIAVIAFVLFILFAMVQYQDFIIRNVLWILALGILLFAIWKYDFIIMMKEYERAVIFRFGKVSRVGGPGWAIVFPPAEGYTKVDLRTHTIDVPKQDVITKDGIQLKIDAIVYLKVKSDDQCVINSIVEVQDYERALSLYVVATIRDLIGSMTLDEVISKIEVLNETLKKQTEEISKEWGVQVETVELKDVDIPPTVIDAMHAQKVAVQRKLARMEEAEGHRFEIDAVKSAAEQLSDKALSYYYIRALERIGDGQATKIIFPLEFSSLLGAIAGRQAMNKTPQGIEVKGEAIKEYAPLIAEYLRQEKESREKGKGGKSDKGSGKKK